MNTNESIKLKGDVAIVLKDQDGNIKDKRDINNLVVNAGLTYIVDRMKRDASGGKAVMTHMAVGSGTTSAGASQTDLVSILGSRESLDSTTISGTNALVYVSSFEAGDGTGAVTEAGIFNASSGGDMLCRTVFTTVNKGSNDTMSITWTITLSAS